MLYRGALFPSRLFYNSICDPGAPPTRRGAAGEATGALARSFVHCNIVKSRPSIMTISRPSLDTVSLPPPPESSLAHSSFGSTSPSCVGEHDSRVFSLPLSVIVRVFRILRIIYERLAPPPLVLDSARRYKSGQRVRNFAGITKRKRAV